MIPNFVLLRSLKLWYGFVFFTYMLTVLYFLLKFLSTPIHYYSPTFTWIFFLFSVCPREAILLSGESGKISSTNYPKSNYTASRNCAWNITVPVGKKVKFVFTDFVLSACSTKPCSNSCSYVELYDGGSTSSPLLGRYCQGPPLNESQFSTGNQMFVSFHPGQIVDRGFEAGYEADTTIGK